MKRTRVVTGGLVVLLCLCGRMVSAGGAVAPGPASQGWPERFGVRNLHPTDHALVYAKQKSAVDRVSRLLATVVQDARQDGAAGPARGLVLVVDAKEELPFDVTKLLDVLAAEAQTQEEESGQSLKDLTQAKEEIEKLGIKMDTVLSLTPIPVPPTALAGLAGELPADAGQRIGWCIMVPTGRRIKASLKTIIEAGMKKEKVGLAERILVGALMPVIESKAVEEMRKHEQAALYKLLLDTQTDLPQEQKQEKVKAYNQKLGLERESKGDREQQQAGAEPTQDE